MTYVPSVTENTVEWIKNEDTATVTFCQPRFITRIRKLAEKYPDECQITHENKDGSIVAHIPVKWIKISKVERHLSEEQIELARERIKIAQEHKRNALKSALSDLGKEV